MDVKMCGLTDAATARRCSDAGATLLGVVFYPKSPRHVTLDVARSIARAVASPTQVVGVFVDEAPERVIETVRACGLHAAQLHGSEPPAVVAAIEAAGIPVIKALGHDATVEMIDAYPCRAILLEMGAKARLPGGNGTPWDWRRAAELSGRKPTLLAGGLAPENVADAIGQAGADGVDVSSGIESSPGIKNPDKIRRFMRAVREATLSLPAASSTILAPRPARSADST